MIPLKFLGDIMTICHRLASSRFRSLIAAKGSPFSASLHPASRGRGFYPEFDQFPVAIRLKRGDMLETDGFPMIFLEFSGYILTICHRLTRPLFKNPNRG